VVGFAPDATSLGIIKVPEYIANFCWGDDDLKSLFIAASSSVYRIRRNTPGLARLRRGWLARVQSDRPWNPLDRRQASPLIADVSRPDGRCRANRRFAALGARWRKVRAPGIAGGG